MKNGYSLAMFIIVQSVQLSRNSIHVLHKNEGFRKRSGLKAPAQPSCLAAKLHSLIFQYLPRLRCFINNFYLKSLNRRKAISGTLILNNNNLDFIAILFLAGCLSVEF